MCSSNRNGLRMVISFEIGKSASKFVCWQKQRGGYYLPFVRSRPLLLEGPVWVHNVCLDLGPSAIGPFDFSGEAHVIHLPHIILHKRWRCRSSFSVLCIEYIREICQHTKRFNDYRKHDRVSRVQPSQWVRIQVRLAWSKSIKWKWEDSAIHWVI